MGLRTASEQRDHRPAGVWDGTVEDWSERALDQVMGDVLLADVRLQKVMRVRQALLSGDQRELALSFAREAVQRRTTDC